MMQRGIGVGDRPDHPPNCNGLIEPLLLNGCKGLSLADLASFQVVLNGRIDHHGSYRPFMAWECTL